MILHKLISLKKLDTEVWDTCSPHADREDFSLVVNAKHHGFAYSQSHLSH
jgi:hypothetical protein